MTALLDYKNLCTEVVNQILCSNMHVTFMHIKTVTVCYNIIYYEQWLCHCSDCYNICIISDTAPKVLLCLHTYITMGSHDCRPFILTFT